jgi:ParB-like chromosome segregation protein Spo0J
MQVEQISIEKLIPYVNNARTHSDAQVAQIAASIKEFRFNNPVLIADDNSIIAGHGRVMAARKLGKDTVPAVRLSHLTEMQRKAYILADNKLALNADWDNSLLAIELADLKDLGFDLSLTGFFEDELARLVIDAEETGMPNLASGDREPLQQIAFMLHDYQAETVRAALDVAKQMGAFVDTGNENSNGNALARVCELFLGQHGNS